MTDTREVEIANMKAFSDWAECNSPVVLISYPRSGRSWILRLAEQSTDRRAWRIFKTPDRDYSEYLFFCWHGVKYAECLSDKARENITFVNLVRDPRDAMMSDAYRRVVDGKYDKMSREVVLAARQELFSEDRGYRVRYDNNPGVVIQYERMALQPIPEIHKLLDLLDVHITKPVDHVVRDNNRIKHAYADANGDVKYDIQMGVEFKTGRDRYSAICLKWKDDPLFTEEDNDVVYTSMRPIMEQYGYTKEGHDLSVLTAQETAGKWAISSNLLKMMVDILPTRSKVLELGSGYGTSELAKHFFMTSIEHNSRWVGIYDSNYIHAPIEDDWYKVSAIEEKIEGSYDALLVDGPSGSERRARFAQHMDLFDLSGWIFFDDIHREPECRAYMKLVDKLGRMHSEYEDDDKAFGVIVPDYQKTLTASYGNYQMMRFNPEKPERRALVVVAYNRPRYIRLTLEGLKKCRGIEDWDIYLYIDGPASDKPDDFLNWLPNMPMRVILRPENLGILNNTIYSIKETFDHGYDAVMWIEDDMLLRPDTLEVAATYKYPGLVSLRESGHSGIRYTPPPNLIGADTFDRLYNWILTMQYVGKWDPKRERVIPDDIKSHDCVVGTWIHDENITVARPDKSYCLHFGVRGRNQGFDGKDATDAARRLEKKMFCGDPSTWIDNTLKMFKSLDGSDLIHDVVYPKDFVYEGS